MLQKLQQIIIGEVLYTLFLGVLSSGNQPASSDRSRTNTEVGKSKRLFLVNFFIQKCPM